MTRFIKMRQAFDAHPGFDPGRPVAKNPRTREHRDAQFPGTLITHSDTKAATELFNAAYATVLLMLMQYYSYGGETPSQRVALQAALRQMMSGCIRPVAEVLTELPIADGSSLTAGPPFELYSDLRLSTQLDNRWVILLERLDIVNHALSDQAAAHPRFAFVSVNIRLIASAIRAVAGRAV